MATKPTHDFGKRRPVTVAPVSTAPAKRSGHVALLLMGTLAVGGGAYALMPRQNCEPPWLLLDEDPRGWHAALPTGVVIPGCVGSQFWRGISA